MITGTQIRLARELLGWRRSKLAERAQLRTATIARAKASEGEAPITIVQENAIRRILGVAGVEFIADEETGPSVRLRKQE
jgi:ribosome-binding protein aMBF1 (putative translation factor)